MGALREASLVHQAVARVDELGVHGAIVEVGVWRGGMSCMMALA